MTAQITTRHLAWRAALAVSTATLLAAILAAPTFAGLTASKLTRLQANRTMALPGVTLPPGTYTFEVVNPPTSANVVLVSSQGPNGRKVHFLGLTRPVERPRNLPAAQVITIDEAPAGAPVPIREWYPVGSSSGYQFLYE